MNEYIVKEVNDRVVALRVIRMAISRQMQIDCDAAAPERRQSTRSLAYTRSTNVYQLTRSRLHGFMGGVLKNGVNSEPL